MARAPAKKVPAKKAAPKTMAPKKAAPKTAARKTAAPKKSAVAGPVRNFLINTLVKHASGTQVTRTRVDGKAIIPPHTHDTDFIIIPNNDYVGKRVYHRGDKVIREEPLTGKKGEAYLVKAPRAGERISVHNLSGKPMMFDKIIMPTKPTKPAKPTTPAKPPKTTKPKTTKPKTPKKAPKKAK